jgi:hypothetical protein
VFRELKAASDNPNLGASELRDLLEKYCLAFSRGLDSITQLSRASHYTLAHNPCLRSWTDAEARLKADGRKVAVHPGLEFVGDITQRLEEAGNRLQR